MSVPTVTLTLIASLLVIGCATREQQLTARKSASEDVKGGWDEFRTWNRMGADHVNIASDERSDWVRPDKGDQR
jgi:hypothetical protein